MKLTSQDKQEIIERLKNGESQSKLAKEYNVSQATISLLAAKYSIQVKPGRPRTKPTPEPTPQPSSESNFLRDRYKYQFDYTINEIKHTLKDILVKLDELNPNK